MKHLQKSLLSLSLVLVTAAGAGAQDVAVVQRLVEQGSMPRDVARRLVRTIDAALEANAAGGGDSYDDLRQKVNQAIFGASAGPGDGPAEYQQRLAQVLERMRSGMDLAVLTQLFAPGRNAAVLCANRYGVTMGECDALLAAASLTPAALPYLAPDDGAALQGVLRRARVRRRTAREIATKLREAMLGVPRSLQNNADGRLMLQLLAACPGGSSDRESQIRAWHIGPTEGMAECIAGAVATRGGAEVAARLFSMSPRAAEAFLQWGAPQAPPPPNNNVVANNTANNTTANNRRRNGRGRRGGPQVTEMSAADALRNQGAAFARAGRLENALAAYEAAIQSDPNHAATHAALGRVKVAMGDSVGAINAYQASLAINAQDANVLVGLARAYVANRQNDAAVASLQQAMRVDYNNMAAREGLRALGGEAPAPPLPETPARDAILATMQPLRGALIGCAPQFSGQVSFRIAVLGATGEVSEVGAQGEMSEDERYCMESVVQSARFPRFTNETLSITYPFRLSPE
ncbi:MAG: tetratricopeptide repeat protein [Myxococcota bacterium]